MAVCERFRDCKDVKAADCLHGFTNAQFKLVLNLDRATESVASGLAKHMGVSDNTDATDVHTERHEVVAHCKHEARQEAV